MNTNWIEFLKTHNANPITDSKPPFRESQKETASYITAIPYLGVLEISGTDAAQFLQGQLTCNVKELTESNSFFSAFCNAKGRTLSTLLIIKKENSFLMILPVELIDVVSKKLQMYILRAKVKLHNVSDELCLIGISSPNKQSLPTLPPLDFSVTQGDEIIVKFPSNNDRYLIISPVQHSINLWTQFAQDSNLTIAGSPHWSYQDISAGVPWLTLDSSEEYIPQMLNIDKLGGISFNKGCYTGQEIIARTHYLGKTKRELFLAECEITAMLDSENKIISEQSESLSGKIVSFQKNEQTLRLLTVLPTTNTSDTELMINNSDQTRINIINFQ